MSVRPGSFTVPAGFDPVTTVLDSLARTPWAHEVSLRVQADAEHIRRHLPPDLATLSPLPHEGRPPARGVPSHEDAHPHEGTPPHEGAAGGGARTEWVRVRMRAERLEVDPGRTRRAGPPVRHRTAPGPG